MSKELKEQARDDGYVDGWWLGSVGVEPKEEDYRQYNNSIQRQSYREGFNEGYAKGKHLQREHDLMGFRRDRDDKHQKHGRIR